MSKLFFDHLIHFEEVVAFLDSHSLAEEEKSELVQIIDEIYHHHVLDLILTHLPKTHHEEFISRLHADPSHPDHLVYLKELTSVDIAAEIQAYSSRLRDELVAEIQKTQVPTPKRSRSR